MGDIWRGKLDAEKARGVVTVTGAFLGGPFLERVGVICGQPMRDGLRKRADNFCALAGIDQRTELIEVHARYMVGTGFLVFVFGVNDVLTFWHDGHVYGEDYAERLTRLARMNRAARRAKTAPMGEHE